jgi:ABC-type phosphate transport system permease subunit
MKQSLLFGFYCLPVGLLIIGKLLSDMNNNDERGFWIFIVTASFSAPAFLWYLIIERKKRLSIKRGIVVGVLGAVLSHYFGWFFILYIGPALDGEIINPLFSMKAALTGSTVSLLLFGLLHLPLGALIGRYYANYVKETKHKTLLKKAADILKII